MPTAEVLDFALAHAAARDAVQAELDVDALEAALGELGLRCVRLASQAGDRRTYLQRPDLGRRLDDASRGIVQTYQREHSTEVDVALVVADGLSAPAVQRQVAPLLGALVPMLRGAGVALSDVFPVRQGRVAVEDEVGALAGAKLALILIGERPGLGSPDSLGAYLVFGPKPGRTDAERNCVSNIRPAGLDFPAAAATLHYLIVESLRRRISGVALKDERAALPSQPAGPQLPSTP